MSQTESRDRLIELRRDLHRHPEPAWREFYTTARIVEELERLGFPRPENGSVTAAGTTFELAVGRDAIDPDARMAVPDEAELARWYDQALEDGADPDLLAPLEGGYTGAVATVRRGSGPHLALRVDIDALPREESTADEHAPAAAGFRSTHEGAMHACGHDAHMAIGIGVLEAILESDFEGAFTVFFQPAEERVAGGKAMAQSGHLADVDALLAVHVGLDHPTGEVVAGIGGFLAVRAFRAEYAGASAHAGGRPEEGRNAVQAMAAAVQNLYAIPRHADGATRVNAGHVGGGSVANIIPESAFIEGEVRGATTPLRDYMWEHAMDVLVGAAEMHDCEVVVDPEAEAPSAESDEDLVEIVSAVAERTANVDSILDRDDLGGSEDATYLMRAVQEAGGTAAYVCIGTDHPGGHHTGTFDVDEDSIGIGVAVLTDAFAEIAGTFE